MQEVLLKVHRRVEAMLPHKSHEDPLKLRRAICCPARNRRKGEDSHDHCARCFNARRQHNGNNGDAKTWNRPRQGPLEEILKTWMVLDLDLQKSLVWSRKDP